MDIESDFLDISILPAIQSGVWYLKFEQQIIVYHFVLLIKNRQIGMKKWNEIDDWMLEGIEYLFSINSFTLEWKKMELIEVSFPNF